METHNKFVAYFRISTQKQGINGNGIHAQQEAVNNFIKHNGNVLIASFTEQESGRKDSRPELLKAIECCRLNDAVLVVAKLDRLSRSVRFIAELMESKIRFVCAEMPEMNDLTIYIFAAMSQHEARLISERTKAGLRQARLRGSRLGKPENLTEEGKRLGQINIKRNARLNPNNRRAYHYASRLRENHKTLKDIADILNAEGYKTRRNGRWTPDSILKLLRIFSDGSADPDTLNQGTAK